MNILFKRYRVSHSFIQSLIVFLLIITLTIAWSYTKAQSVSSNVLNSFGATVYFQDQTYDSSLGELVVSTLQARGYVRTQGFLQPIDLKVPCSDVIIKAYPNPVLLEMTIFAEGCDIEVATIKTYDLVGKLVFEGKPVNNKINFSSIGIGVYLVRVYNQDNQVVGVVKILKSTI